MKLEDYSSKLAKLGSSLTGLMILYAMFQQYFPFEINFRKLLKELMSRFIPYVDITFYESTDVDAIKINKAYASIDRYLGYNSSMRAMKLKGDMNTEDGTTLILSLDNQENIVDVFEGVKVNWASSKTVPGTSKEEITRFYKLTFHRKDRDLITKRYLDHVMREGKEIAIRTRTRKLYTNIGGEHWYGSKKWSHVSFEHPASFDTLAMENSRKEDIIDDLITFSKAKDYYAKIGKAWKRGYLLYGPPGTGKSTMIAAMANLLEYDIYDLELVSVRDNIELKKLLIQTTCKSIIVIEDIDCSLNLTGKRNEEKKEKEKNDAENDKGDGGNTKVTLSGILNSLDGIWSAIGSERIIVITTNYVEKLDPALIRRGRMDKHIELSYCCFEAFKVIVKNYWDIESHDLFETVGKLLEETNMTPADVAENLMPKRSKDDASACLENLVKELDGSKKEQQRLIVEKEEEICKKIRRPKKSKGLRTNLSKKYKLRM